jgi:hypothetical protein
MATESRKVFLADLGIALLLDVVCIGVTAAIVLLSRYRERAKAKASQAP